MLARLRGDGQISGWHDELYPVAAAFDAPPHCLLERAAAPHFGIKAYGALAYGARPARRNPSFPKLLARLRVMQGPLTAGCASISHPQSPKMSRKTEFGSAWLPHGLHVPLHGKVGCQCARVCVHFTCISAACLQPVCSCTHAS